MNHIVRLYKGVYEASGGSSAEIFHDGLHLQRFMDIFYVSGATDLLNAEQVEALCRSRAEHPATFTGGANAQVRQIFKRFVASFRPSTLLEVGAGTNPLFSTAEASAYEISYVRSDADPTNVEGGEIFSGTTSSLRYPPDHFKLAVAIFVLHFKFYDVQISELHRCLSSLGLFIANVYRRSSASRMKLLEDFRCHGFKCELIDDPQSLCRTHQYLIAAKSDSVLLRGIEEFKKDMVNLDV